MNASIVRRSAVILGAIAIPWVGCSVWSARRDRAERETLAAEIRAEIAARPTEPDMTEGRVDLTESYAAALAGLAVLSDDMLPREFAEAMEATRPWESIPGVVSRTVEAHAGSLAAFEIFLEGAPPGFVRPDYPMVMRGGAARELLVGRGLVSVARGDWSRAIHDARLLRRARELFFPVPPGADALARLRHAAWAHSSEELALDVFEIAARSGALTETAAGDALASANGIWLQGECLAAIRTWARDCGDDFVLRLLGDDPEALLRQLGVLKDRSLVDRVQRRFGEESASDDDATDAPKFTGAPSVVEMRRMRAAVKRLRDLEARRDGAALAPDGPIDREFHPELGTGWPPGMIYVPIATVRRHWRQEARIPVVRAALAIRVHEHRTGAAPASLQELVPSILDAVPVDPWTREPVKYTPKPGGGWIVEAGPPGPERDRGGEVVEETGPVRLER